MKNALDGLEERQSRENNSNEPPYPQETTSTSVLDDDINPPFRIEGPDQVVFPTSRSIGAVQLSASIIQELLEE